MPHVEILGKRYELMSLDPMPVDLVIRRMQIRQAAAQAAGGSGAVPYEVLLELAAACLGQTARHLSAVPWRTPIGPYGVAVIRDILASCPAEMQAQALEEIQAAALAAWHHLAPMGSSARPEPEQATEKEAKDSEDFSERRRASTSP